MDEKMIESFKKAADAANLRQKMETAAREERQKRGAAEDKQIQAWASEKWFARRRR
jgi:hypothetical protein